MQMELSGKLVKLRPFTSAAEYRDLNHAVWTQKDEWWGYGWVGLARLEKDFANFGMVDESHFYTFLAIEGMESGELVGYEVLQIPGPGQIASEIGTVILEPYWRRGFGREAKLLAMQLLFDNWPVELVYAGTLANHEAAVGGMLSCGMHELGRTGPRAFSMGQWTGQVFCGITRAQWQEHPANMINRRE